MATATHGIFGYTGSVGKLISARSRREPKYSKQKQTRMICAILSRRMMSPPSYEEVSDYVDSNVTYAENKREVLAVFGERSRTGHMSDKDMRESYCTSLHNSCASNGIETCQVACDECKNPAACKKADKISKEIKKHGRELTHFEQMEAERAREAKRPTKKAKFSTGQIVKCREGYDLQCGFSGARKITQVKAYPDYVMYGITGKARGFVEEDWIVGVKVKPVLKEKKKSVYVIFKGVKKHRLRCPICGRSAHENFCIVHSDVEALDLETSKKAQKLVAENLKYQKEHGKKKIKKLKTLPERRGMTTEGEIKQAVQSGAFKRETAKYHKEVEQELERLMNPPKPTPAKVTKPSKKTKKVKPTKVSKPSKKPKAVKPTKTTSQIKPLTKNQQALLRKYRFVDVSIQGKMYHITKQNVKDGKIEWYKKNGKVCLKNRR